MRDRILEVNNLKTEFLTGGGRVQAVRGISLHVDRGEFVGIVGESGCGKSVTMLSITQLLGDNGMISADSILFDGVNLLGQNGKYMRGIQGSRIGMIFQDPMTSLNPLFSIGDQIMEPLRIHKKMTKSAARQKAITMLELVGIPSPEKRLKQYPHEFSGGMRQRVMIAIAMCCDPQLLIADEPTTALDVTIQAQILDLMTNLQREYNTSTVLITHDLGVIASTCSRVIVMYGGLIMEEGAVEDIFYHPAHPYTVGLLKSVPNVSGGIRGKLIPINGSPPDLMNPPDGCPFAARCEYAMKICKSYMPNRVTLKGNHTLACWLNSKSAQKLGKGVIHVAG